MLRWATGGWERLVAASPIVNNASTAADTQPICDLLRAHEVLWGITTHPLSVGTGYDSHRLRMTLRTGTVIVRMILRSIR